MSVWHLENEMWYVEVENASFCFSKTILIVIGIENLVQNKWDKAMKQYLEFLTTTA